MDKFLSAPPADWALHEPSVKDRDAFVEVCLVGLDRLLNRLKVKALEARFRP